MSAAKVTRKSVLAKLTQDLGDENCAEREERKVSFEEAELETQQSFRLMEYYR